MVYVFKSEDQASLLDLGVSVDVRTTPPYIDMPAVPPTPDPQSKLIVFTGAFWRAENSEGAQWFMERVWPYLVRRCPEVRVRFAGSRPPEWLTGISSDRVEVTGYLPDLTEAYRGAAMAIAPLVRGAGLKFKVVQAVALGYPIVGTSVAAEGIASLFGREAVDVNDDPVDFAEAIIASLQHLDVRIGQSRVIMNSARGRLNFSHDIQEQIQNYNKLIVSGL
jgi:glycosyltransferase involved in cell wall biosynthesis